jgi:AcrR family transcriptional regulator
MGASDQHGEGTVVADAASSGPGRGAVRRRDDGRLLRGRRTRARLREAARELILEVGFDRATLRGIAERAGMGASSIYRHLRSKEELLIWELADLQGEAWTRFRQEDDRSAPTRERVARFFGVQHELLARNPDFTVIALRAATYPHVHAARDSLRLTDRTIALLAEILQSGRKNGDLDPAIDLLSAANALCHVATSARISWANGLLTEEGCRKAIEASVELLFRGIGRAPVSPPGSHAPGGA